MQPKAAILFDRDGTLNSDQGYTVKPEDMFILPGAGTAVARLKRAGFFTAIISNQSAIGRGMCSEADVLATNAECLKQLAAEDRGAKIDAVCFCPHAPEESCECRKPKTGMLKQLPVRIDAQASWMIGDKCLDIEFGLNAGIPLSRCLLVQTGEGSKEFVAGKSRWGEGIESCADLAAAADRILGELK